tara:strand:- start:589 stop:1032 length:444 start_codon:yes stop_codon:yes gene_type:complete
MRDTSTITDKEKLALRDAVEFSCDYWMVDPSMIFSKDRARRLVYARHSAKYYLTYLHKNLSLPKIAQLTECDHSSVIHSRDTFEDLTYSESDFAILKRRLVVRKDKNELEGITKTLFTEIQTIITTKLSIDAKTEAMIDLFKQYENR